MSMLYLIPAVLLLFVITSHIALDYGVIAKRRKLLMWSMMGVAALAALIAMYQAQFGLWWSNKYMWLCIESLIAWRLLKDSTYHIPPYR